MGLNMTHIKISLTAILIMAGVSLGGCAGASDKYASLAMRDFEKADPAQYESDDTVVAPSISTEGLAVVRGLVANAQSAHQRFMSAAPGARQAVNAAIGAGVTENRWASAQVALADLDSLRSQAAIPLGDLDRIFVEASVELAEAEEVSSARQEVVSMIEQEDRLLADLRGKLRQ